MGFRLFAVQYPTPRRRLVVQVGEVPTLAEAVRWVQRESDAGHTGVFFEYTPSDLLASVTVRTSPARLDGLADMVLQASQGVGGAR